MSAPWVKSHPAKQGCFIRSQSKRPNLSQLLPSWLQLLCSVPMHPPARNNTFFPLCKLFGSQHAPQAASPVHTSSRTRAKHSNPGRWTCIHLQTCQLGVRDTSRCRCRCRGSLAVWLQVHVCCTRRSMPIRDNFSPPPCKALVCAANRSHCMFRLAPILFRLAHCNHITNTNVASSLQISVQTIQGMLKHTGHIHTVGRRQLDSNDFSGACAHRLLIKSCVRANMYVVQ